MQILVAVNLMAFMVGVLLLFSVVTPHDRRGASNKRGGPYPLSETPRRARFVKH